MRFVIHNRVENVDRPLFTREKFHSDLFRLGRLSCVHFYLVTYLGEETCYFLIRSSDGRHLLTFHVDGTVYFAMNQIRQASMEII
jgi:hypothetical protein